MENKELENLRAIFSQIKFDEMPKTLQSIENAINALNTLIVSNDIPVKVISKISRFKKVLTDFECGYITVNKLDENYLKKEEN